MALKYSLIGKIDLLQASKVLRAIDLSKKVEIANELPDGRLNHIVIKNTTTPVGYIGRDTLEKVNFGDETLRPYHEFLDGIYRIITNINKAF